MPVLVVDDDAVSRHEIAEILLQEGYEVVTAVNGREALKIIGRGECPLVITDWMMPEVNGINLCRAIRRGDPGIPVYIVVVSSLNDPRDAQLALSSGANDFISKPLDRSAFLAKVRDGERSLQLAMRPCAIEPSSAL